MLKDTVIVYENKLDDMGKDADELHDLFVKELQIKEVLLDQTNHDKESLI